MRAASDTETAAIANDPVARQSLLSAEQACAHTWYYNAYGHALWTPPEDGNQLLGLGQYLQERSVRSFSNGRVSCTSSGSTSAISLIPSASSCRLTMYPSVAAAGTGAHYYDQHRSAHAGLLFGTYQVAPVPCPPSFDQRKRHINSKHPAKSIRKPLRSPRPCRHPLLFARSDLYRRSEYRHQNIFRKRR